MKDAEYRIMQNGIVVASVCAPEPQAHQEILRYAAQYAQDGACTIERKSNRRWVRHADYVRAA